MTELPENREYEQKNSWRDRIRRFTGARATEVVVFNKPEFTSPQIEELRRSPQLEHPTFLRVNLSGASSEAVAGMNDIVSLPVANFISAPDFSDWETGRTDGYKYSPTGTCVKSSKLIRKYARLPAETSPAINMAQAIRQPNGLVLYKLVGDGAHRLAAAMRRGDQYIQVTKGVDLYDSDEDYIALPTQDEAMH